MGSVTAPLFPLRRKNEVTWRGLPTDPKIPIGLQFRPKKSAVAFARFWSNILYFAFLTDEFRVGVIFLGRELARLSIRFSFSRLN